MKKTKSRENKQLLDLILEIMHNRGWQVEIRTGERPGEIMIEEGGCIVCSDGRPFSHAKNNEGEAKTVAEGWKVLGGVLYLATQKGGDEKALREACQHYLKIDMIPTVHGSNHGEYDCGFENLVLDHKLEGFELSLTAEEASRIVLEEGGMHQYLAGNHEEKELHLNLRKGKTAKAIGSEFLADLEGYLDTNEDLEFNLNTIMSTIEQLGGNKRVVIWV